MNGNTSQVQNAATRPLNPGRPSRNSSTERFGLSCFALESIRGSAEAAEHLAVAGIGELEAVGAPARPPSASRSPKTCPSLATVPQRNGSSASRRSAGVSPPEAAS